MKKLKAYLIVPFIALVFDLISPLFMGKLFLRHESEFERIQDTDDVAPFLRAVLTDPWTIVFLAVALALHVAALVVLIKAIRKKERYAVLILILRITNVVLYGFNIVLLLSRLIII